MDRQQGLRIETEEDFGAFYCMMHYGIVLASNIHNTRSMQDVFVESEIETLLDAVSDPPSGDQRKAQTPAGTPLRQLRVSAVDGRPAVPLPLTVVLNDTQWELVRRYVHYGVQRAAPGTAWLAAKALRVVGYGTIDYGAAPQGG